MPGTPLDAPGVLTSGLETPELLCDPAQVFADSLANGSLAPDRPYAPLG
jgi:hypothetical protein